MLVPVDSNIYRLVDDLSELLDTRSKRTLWNHVIPLLTTAHQEFCQQVIGLSKATFTGELFYVNGNQVRVLTDNHINLWTVYGAIF